MKYMTIHRSTMSIGEAMKIRIDFPAGARKITSLTFTKTSHLSPPVKFKQTIEYAVIEGLVESVNQSAPQPFIDSLGWLDGCDFKVKIVGDSHRVTYQWTSHACEQWSPLEHFVQATQKLVEEQIALEKLIAEDV